MHNMRKKNLKISNYKGVLFAPNSQKLEAEFSFLDDFVSRPTTRVYVPLTM